VNRSLPEKREDHVRVSIAHTLRIAEKRCWELKLCSRKRKNEQSSRRDERKAQITKVTRAARMAGLGKKQRGSRAAEENAGARGSQERRAS